jgi:acetoacetate decarboxylase
VGFVKRPEEVARIQRTLSHPRLVNGEVLSVDFLSDADAVASVLPPPLRPGREARVTAIVGRWQSNFAGDFAGGALHVAACHRGVPGSYVLAAFLDGDAPTVLGRDLLGGPHKLAASALHRHGATFGAWLERGGVRLIELHGVLGTDLGALETDLVLYGFKSRAAADGIGLQEDAILTRTTLRTRSLTARRGAGSVVLRGTVHDPLDDLPVRSVLRATFLEGDLLASSQTVATTPRDVFLPYHLGRHDDPGALDTESAVLVPVA